MIDFFLGLLGTVVGVGLGGYILLYGRRALWASFGIIALAATANLLAVLVAGVDSGWDLLPLRAWVLLGIALAAGALGVYLGRTNTSLSVGVIGFVAGADIALWLYDVSFYIVTAVAQLSEQVALWVGVAIIVLGGFGGLWFIRKFRNEGLILITMILGVQMIALALGLSTSSSWTAVIVLSLGLFSVIWQYADHLRNLNVEAAPYTENILESVLEDAPS